MDYNERFERNIWGGLYGFMRARVLKESEHVSFVSFGRLARGLMAEYGVPPELHTLTHHFSTNSQRHACLPFQCTTSDVDISI